MSCVARFGTRVVRRSARATRCRAPNWTGIDGTGFPQNHLIFETFDTFIKDKVGNLLGKVAGVGEVKDILSDERADKRCKQFQFSSCKLCCIFERTGVRHRSSTKQKGLGPIAVGQLPVRQPPTAKCRRCNLQPPAQPPPRPLPFECTPALRTALPLRAPCGLHPPHPRAPRPPTLRRRRHISGYYNQPQHRAYSFAHPDYHGHHKPGRAAADPSALPDPSALFSDSRAYSRAYSGLHRACTSNDRLGDLKSDAHGSHRPGRPATDTLGLS